MGWGILQDIVNFTVKCAVNILYFLLSIFPSFSYFICSRFVCPFYSKFEVTEAKIAAIMMIIKWIMRFNGNGNNEINNKNNHNDNHGNYDANIIHIIIIMPTIILITIIKKR